MPTKKTTPSTPQNEPQVKNAESKKPQLEMLEVAALSPHPRQIELVGDMPPAEFEALVADVEAHGIQTPLIVLADGKTLVCGHQRLRAARQLGLKTVPCIVRGNLDDPDDPPVIELLLNDNLRRRQLSPLEKARYAKKLAQIEYQRRTSPNLRFDDYEGLAVRDAVGKLLGCSGRNAARYLAVLDTPPEIQQAFGAALLSLALTARVSFLTPDLQQKLADSIGKMRSRSTSKEAKIKEKVQALVKSALLKARPPKRVRPASAAKALHMLKGCLDAHLDAVRTDQAAIIKDLRGDEFSSEMRASPLFAATYSLRRQIVRELKEQCNSLSQCLDQIEEGIEPESREA
jgi:ParB-like chromosome segregation protein Spo0J